MKSVGGWGDKMVSQYPKCKATMGGESPGFPRIKQQQQSPVFEPF